MAHCQFSIFKKLPWREVIRAVVKPVAAAHVLGQVMASFIVNIAREFAFMPAGRAGVAAGGAVVFFEGVAVVFHDSVGGWVVGGWRVMVAQSDGRL